MNDLAAAARCRWFPTRTKLLPRVLAIAAGLPARRRERLFQKSQFTEFCVAFEETTPLEFHEIGCAGAGAEAGFAGRNCGAGTDGLLRMRRHSANATPRRELCPTSELFQHVTQTSWEDELESLIPFDGILRDDPAGAYARDESQRAGTCIAKRWRRLAHRSDLYGARSDEGSA